MGIYFTGANQRAFGTWPMRGEELAQAIEAAIDVGYRAFDTAQMYRNEREVGAALAASGKQRSEFFITTKVHPDNFDADRFIPSVEQSLADLSVDKVDVLLLHWPPIGGDVAPSLRRLQEAHDRGLATHIGISNYTAAMMRTAREVVDAPLVTNQVEFHPLLDQSVLLATTAEIGIPLSAHCAVARGAVTEHPLFAEIGDSKGKSATQVALRWSLQMGVALTVKSARPEIIRANFEIMDFSLSSVEMAQIQALNATGYRICGANVAPWAPDFD